MSPPLTDKHQGQGKLHLCKSSNCDCGMSRRDFLQLSALSSAALAAPLLFAHDAQAQTFKGDNQPVRIGYLPITDATPLLVAHARKLFEAEGLHTEPPRLFRSWAQIVEAFVAGQVNVIHLLSPATLWVRYGTKFPAKVVAWNHVNGSALTVDHSVNNIADLGGQTVAIPFWYSIHNILLQQLLRSNGLQVVTRARDAAIKPNEVNLIVLPPAEMVSALASKNVRGYIVAEPFNAAAETAGIGKILRFSGDVWKNHACCVTFLAERDINERPEWTQRVTNAIVKAQLWTRSNQIDTARLLSNTGENRYTPHTLQVLSKVLATTDYSGYERTGIIRHRDWNQRRIDFQPYPFTSYTEELVKALVQTKVEGDNRFLSTLNPQFVARDLIDERFVRRAIDAVGGPTVFGLPPGLVRNEVIAV
ncbi:NitT/TauT family transport system substrate-binding protein [Herbaspirillum sp. Sphag1AN]|uniref:ABC transporter substrate-binding protein n=1 Tax=unclassified Herbaspirillum TaxID=2624150 RepID=UPI00161E569B|nr:MULTISPECIES: ABC transporter substrate-binding protein [unclassified Herbaspirillum]MBB3211860.1 NitT/TauT family transport system substrate-binding protein [Herbaspirillum sp. Sphag1AN]MBB3244306.1 NitT/TauT family transport system substrate-binding protein [Herbaspirillum sp. Sphag64]